MAAKKKTAKKSSPKRSPVSTLLIKQHREVKKLFKQLEDGSGNAPALLKQLADNLSAHMAIEQDIYYPAVKDLKEDLVNESYEEHSLAELGLKRLLGTSPDDEAWKARVTACKELIEHHVEEEEDELFRAVDRKMGADELRDMARHMKERFDDVVAAGFEAAVPKGFARTSADVSKR